MSPETTKLIESPLDTARSEFLRLWMVAVVTLAPDQAEAEEDMTRAAMRSIREMVGRK